MKPFGLPGARWQGIEPAVCNGQSREVLALGASLGPPALVPWEQSSSLHCPLEPQVSGALVEKHLGMGRRWLLLTVVSKLPWRRSRKQRRKLIKLGFPGAELGAGSCSGGGRLGGWPAVSGPS